MRKRFFILPAIIFIANIFFCSPNEPKKEDFTAKEAEESFARDIALKYLTNPSLVSIEALGGGVDRTGRLVNKKNGKWRFGFLTLGETQGILINVEGIKVDHALIHASNLLSSQELFDTYIDSPQALELAEKNGGKNLTDVNIITCTLLGEPIWPVGNPKKVAWEVLYKLNNGTKKYFYIEAYTGVYLGDG